jgi:putative tryptophan/tyrosine transport system substrate-binding protein
MGIVSGSEPRRAAGNVRRLQGEKSVSKRVFRCGLFATLFALCFSVEAQQPKAPRIGFLFGASPSANAGRIEAFRQGLRELGYIEGKNIVIEDRYAEEN